MKKGSMIFIFLLTIMFTNTVVSASSVSIKVSSGSVTKGNKVTVTASVNADSGIYTTEGKLTCSGAGVDESANLGFEDMDTKTTSQSFSLTLKPTSSGTITCQTSGVLLRELAVEKGYSLNNAKVTISVTEPVVVTKPQKEYSSNNYLKALTVEGFSLSPEFNKETKEYSVELPNGTEKINVVADKENGYAKVEGTGFINVTEGANKIEIKVTAENGNVRTYIINATVKELNKIEVTIDKKKYNIIRRYDEDVVIPSNYEESSIKIDDEDVLCLKNSKTNSILVFLKDEEGNSGFYTYDEKTKTYSKYYNMEVGSLSLNILSMPNDLIPNGYKKVVLSYDNNKIDAYQYVLPNKTYAADDEIKGSDFYLVYALNEKTGEKALYVYDKLEGTIQRFNSDLTSAYKDDNNKYFLYMLISLALLAISIISLAIVLIKQKKHKTKFA